MTILELREKRNTAWDAAKAFLESHRTENGTLTAEDDATYSKMEQHIADLGKEISRLERQEAMEAELSKPVTTPLTSKPSSDMQKASKTGRASDAYKAGMLTALRTNFRKVSDVLQEGVDADGGYLVPEEYDRRLIKTLKDGNIMRHLGHDDGKYSPCRPDDRRHNAGSHRVCQTCQCGYEKSCEERKQDCEKGNPGRRTSEVRRLQEKLGGQDRA